MAEGIGGILVPAHTGLKETEIGMHELDGQRGTHRPSGIEVMTELFQAGHGDHP